MLDNLYSLLYKASDTGDRLEITTKQVLGGQMDDEIFIAAEDGHTFTGISWHLDEAEHDLGWTFRDVEGWEYSGLPLKDIAKVRRVGETEYAYIAENKSVEVA